MAANTYKPTEAPRRANVPRAPEPAPGPPPAPAAVAPEPVVEAPRPRAAAPERPAPPPRPPRVPRTWSLFSVFDRMTSVDGLFREGLPVRYLPHLLFVMFLTLLYIGNTHYGNRMSRNIQRLKQETEDLRADYTTLKSDYMEASKQSEVARKVAAFGLVESSSPPFRIQVPAGHLDAAALELMPVLTADTLAARAGRDSLAAQRADALAGRRRYASSGTEGEPEIAAAIPEDSLAAATPAPVRRAPKLLMKKTKAKTARKPDDNKLVKKSTKSTTEHKKQAARTQLTTSHRR
ncbi:FtsL-like putative cell division protein [Hymenobacter sp. PAMC 26628]|uniref:FtsL-like putative cell division protein n=1 Tax=Hymenobacter sp. PAMC 26628 TaxID=1484118 RepID=UPI0009020539|nr:FtsL-like putative cell division protein [Hymenobacter sp. PAMC 26628]